MEKKDYSKLLKDPRWQKKRLEIFTRDKWTCTLCGDTKETLNVHHKKYSGNPWDATDEDLITLCESCHSEVEYFKKELQEEVLAIIKSDGWTHEHRMMFIKTKVGMWLRIYNEDNIQISGFDFPDIYLNHILKILNAWQKDSSTQTS